jgi:hypothetical protein
MLSASCGALIRDGQPGHDFVFLNIILTTFCARGSMRQMDKRPTRRQMGLVLGALGVASAHAQTNKPGTETGKTSIHQTIDFKRRPRASMKSCSMPGNSAPSQKIRPKFNLSPARHSGCSAAALRAATMN